MSNDPSSLPACLSEAIKVIDEKDKAAEKRFRFFKIRHPEAIVVDKAKMIRQRA